MLASQPNPAGIVLDRLAQAEGIRGNEQATQAITAMRGDRQFQDALNLAIRNDPTVAQGLVGMTSGNGLRDASGREMDVPGLVRALGDQNARGMMTQVLRKVGEPVPEGQQDRFTMTYLQSVITDAEGLNESNLSPAERARRAEALRTRLGEAGINNTGVNLMATGGPMALLSQMFNNPNKFFQDLPGLLGLQGPQAAAMQQLGGFMGGFMELVLGGQGGYRDFFNHYGPRLAAGVTNFATAAMGEQQPAAAPNAPRTGTAGIRSAGGNEVTAERGAARTAFGAAADPNQPEEREPTIRPPQPTPAAPVPAMAGP
jgi:hypothetical protein